MTLDFENGPATRHLLEDLRKRIERESYWCEDCQQELPKDEQFLQSVGELHADHEVVRITVIEGWLASEIDSAIECPYCKGYPTAEESQSHQESECTCPKPCGAGGCPKECQSTERGD